jgi:hypothetical protein
VLQFDSSYDAAVTLDPDVVVNKVRDLQPYNTFSWERGFHEPSRRLRDVFDAFAESYFDPTVDSSYGYRDPWAPYSGATMDLIYYFDDHKYLYLERDRDYELPVYSLALSDPTPDQGYPFIGFAPAMNADMPVPHAAFNLFWPDALTESGRGQTLTVVHEVGHHLGLSHPHDGFDAEWGFGYVANDQFYFAWLGGESNSVMSYFNLQDGDFSQFDLDNMNRWMTYEHLALANHLAGRILESPRASKVHDLLLEADRHAGLALASFHAMQYEQAVRHAAAASAELVTAAETIDVVTDPGSSPGVWGTDGMDRSPFLRQFVNELRDRPAALDSDQLPTPLTLEFYLEDAE